MLASTDRLEWGTEVMVSCEPGYLFWDQTVRRSLECLPFGKWSSVTLPICSRKYFVRKLYPNISSLVQSVFQKEFSNCSEQIQKFFPSACVDR